MAFKPITFALWLAVAGVSFGLSLNAGWLVLAGLFGAVAVLGACVAWYFLSKPH